MRAAARAPGKVLAWVGVAVVVFRWVARAPGYWVFTANAGLILAVSTLGLTIVVGWIREVSLAQAGLTGTAVYVCAYAYRPGHGWGLPYVVAAGIAIGAVMLLSLLIALAAER